MEYRGACKGDRRRQEFKGRILEKGNRTEGLMKIRCSQHNSHLAHEEECPKPTLGQKSAILPRIQSQKAKRPTQVFLNLFLKRNYLMEDNYQ